MAKLANSHLPAARVRMYLVVGAAMLAGIVVLYIVLSRPNSAWRNLPSMWSGIREVRTKSVLYDV